MQTSHNAALERHEPVPCPPCKCPITDHSDKDDEDGGRRTKAPPLPPLGVSFDHPPVKLKRNLGATPHAYRTSFGGLIENRPVFIGHDFYNISRYRANRSVDGDVMTYNGVKHDFCIRPYELYPHRPEWKGYKVCLPSYVIVGVLKGGTSSVYMYLTHHPDVYHPVKKEICWMRYTRVPGSGVDDVELYRSKFPLMPDQTNVHVITGEGCPFFICDMGVPELLHELLPHTRLILLLRNPVDRLYSMFNMRVRYKDDKFKGDEIFEDYIKCWRDFHGNMECQADHRGTRDFIYESKYVHHLRRWIKYYPLSPQWLIASSEEFYSQEKLFMSELFLHLGLPAFELTPAQLQPANTDPNREQHHMSPLLFSLLSEFYAPYNEELYALLDFDFGWNNFTRLYAKQFPFNELYDHETGIGIMPGQSESRDFYVPSGQMFRPDKPRRDKPDDNVANRQPQHIPESMRYQHEVPIHRRVSSRNPSPPPVKSNKQLADQVAQAERKVRAE